MELLALMMSFLEAPAVLIAVPYLGLVLYWYLRVVVKKTGSYRVLAEQQGPPGAVEQGIWIAVLVAGAFVVAFKVALT